MRRGVNKPDPPSPPGQSGWDATFVEHCKKLAAERLLGAASRLFREQTECDLHVVWAPRGALGWNDCEPEFRTHSCPPEAWSRRADGCCLEFGRKHLAGILAAGTGTHGFVCPFHVRTVGCRIVAGGVLLGIAFFQASEGTSRGACRRHGAVDPAISLEDAARRVAERPGDALQIAMRCHSSRVRPENTEITFFQ